MIWRWLLARPKLAIGLALAIGAAGYIGILRYQLHRAETKARANRLAYLNAEARVDTTRLLFQDSLRGSTRLVEQLQVESHARLVEKNREAKARADMQVSFDSLRVIKASGSNLLLDSSDVRVTSWATDSVDPIQVRATARVPVPPAPAEWDVSVTIEPAFLTLELACEGDRARADVLGPPWLRIRLHQVTQDPAICSPPPLPADRRGWIRRHLALALTAGYGVVRDSSWHRGWGTTVGLSYHP